METRTLPFTDDAIAEAARLILAGEPVAMPTETVYGLAADATSGEAVARIYEAKGRPSFNPLIVHVLDIDQAIDFGAIPNPAARRIARDYWPGPLTLVVPVSPFAHLAKAVTAGLGTVAIRSPAHPAMRALLAATGRPLAAPSANASGRVSPTRAEHVLTSLNGRIPAVIDAGPTERGLESTILKIVADEITVLREGPIEGSEVAALGYLFAEPASRWRIEAPGQLASHYSPGKPVRLNAEAAETDEYLIGFGDIAGDGNLSPSGDLVEAAARLFDLLHEAQASAKPRVAVAPIPDGGLGAAINDRLKRAAA